VYAHFLLTMFCFARAGFGSDSCGFYRSCRLTLSPAATTAEKPSAPLPPAHRLQ
jgi:hypothetical protein